MEYIKSLEYYAKNNNKEYLLEEFSSKNSKKPNEITKATANVHLWNCQVCKSEYTMKVCTRTSCQNSGCPYCAGKRVNHTNCLWTTHPEVAKLLVDKNRGYEILAWSNKDELFKCSNCENIVNKRIAKVTERGFSCSKCSDGISYPMKFMTNILDQINIKYEIEKSFEWTGKKRYDFYIKSLSCIIEVHGEQHYKQSEFTKSLQEEQENDRIKEKLAKENRVKNYIVIDCRKSNLEFIKRNILNSELNTLLNLPKINWLKCHEFACCSFVKIACDIWNNSDGLSVTDISKQMNLSRSVVRKYLKQGVGLGWCDYDPKKETENKYDKMRRKIVQLSDCGHFIREWNYIKEAADLLQINKSNITQVCKGRDKSAGGYIWMYLNDYKKHNNVLNVNIGKRKRVVQLSLTDEFLNEWKSLTEANFSLDIGINRICAVCKGKSKTAGGYKWMYKEDYDQYIEQAK